MDVVGVAERICPQCNNQRRWPSNRKICSGCRTFNLRVSRGEVLPPSYEDVTVDGYKEPMKPVENGFGYYGAITTTKDGEKVQCHICGYLFSHLSAHIRTAHELSPKDYKQMYGLRIKDGLVGRIERERLQRVYGDVLRSFALDNLKKAHAASKSKRDSGWQAGGDQWKDITRNEKGMCRDQTLAKIKHIASLNNGVANRSLFESTYGKGQISVVEHWFGNWPAACRTAGVKDTRLHSKMIISDKLDAAIERIQEFYEKYGRTPQSADFDSENDLPTQRWVSRHFGGLNKARAAAGVPILIHIGGGKWQEQKS